MYEIEIPSDELSQQEARIIQAECNFQEYPIFRLDTKTPRLMRQPITFERTIKTPKGDILEQQWVVTGDPILGLPGAFDYDVSMALEELAYEQDAWKPPYTVHFSTYRLAELMDKPHSGIVHRRIQTALERLQGTNIRSRNAFYSKEEHRHLSLSFHLIETLLLYDRSRRSHKDEDPCFEWNVVTFNKVYAESRGARYVRPIDNNFFFSLKNPFAKRLYCLLDLKRRGIHDTLRIALKNLADAIPLSTKDVRFQKRNLATAHARLTEMGYLTSPPTFKKEDKRWNVYYKFTRGRGDTALAPAATALINRGIPRDIAIRISSTYDQKNILDHCLSLDWLLRAGKQITSPGAYLRTAITDNLPLPDGFIRAQEQQEHDRKRLEEDRREQLKQEKNQIEKNAAEILLEHRYNDMPEEQRLNLWHNIIAEQPEFMQKIYQGRVTSGELKPGELSGSLRILVLGHLEKTEQPKSPSPSQESPIAGSKSAMHSA